MLFQGYRKVVQVVQIKNFISRYKALQISNGNDEAHLAIKLFLQVLSLRFSYVWQGVPRHARPGPSVRVPTIVARSQALCGSRLQVGQTIHVEVRPG